MGLEYRHYLIPENPSFVPSTGVIKRVDAVLEKWELKAEEPWVYNLTADKPSKVEVPLHSLIFGQGFAVRYLPVEGLPVANIMGPSYREHVPDDDRCLDSLVFIVGLDFRIHPGDETWSITVNKPPYEGATKQEPYWDHDKVLYTHAQAFHGTLSTTPPEVAVETHIKSQVIDPKFAGYWRTALIIDCNKDVPRLPYNGDFKLPNRNFVSEIEEALGCKVIEVGLIG